MQTLITQELGINAKRPVQKDVTETRPLKNWAEISNFLTENLKPFFFFFNKPWSLKKLKWKPGDSMLKSKYTSLATFLHNFSLFGTRFALINSMNFVI